MAILPIQLLFCKSELTLSKLIMWGLNEPSSHLAIDLASNEDVVHSDLLGLHNANRAEFFAAHTVVDTFTIYLDLDAQAKVEQKLMTYVRNDHGDYDYGAFMYFAYRACARRFSGTPMPATNPWGTDNSYLCTEAAYLLNQSIAEVAGKTILPYDVDLGAISPWALRAILMQHTGGKNELDLRTIADVTDIVQRPA